MDHVMLTPDLMEVRGAESEIGARQYAERVSGRIVDRCLYVISGIYQVALR